jgi:PPK2 family polyphosphate:nucleotide phosphotransferase
MTQVAGLRRKAASVLFCSRLEAGRICLCGRRWIVIKWGMKSQPLIIQGKVRLADFEPGYCQGLEKEKTKAKTDKLAERIGELQELLYANSRCAVLLLFQGMDASGKDGAVRHVLKYVNPAGVETANFKVPSEEERAHDYLWRVHKAEPRRGNIGVFNRSHYEAVLAERVLKIVPKKIWSARYAQIVDFEQMLVENGIVLLKFCLHISKEEQAERFRERLVDPRKRWKFSHADLTTRQLWDDYMSAYEDMLNATSHKSAPWHLVPADRNWYRDYVITQAVVRAMEGLKMKWPQPREDLSQIKIV